MLFPWTDEEIENLLQGIFARTIRPRALPASLYFTIADYLKRALYQGFGDTPDGLLTKITEKKLGALGDLELLQELRTNVYMFSAAKTYQQVREMSSYLVNDNGSVIPFNEFKKKAIDTFDMYNRTWLATEYDTAIGQGQNAITWQQAVQQSDVLPLLKYDAVLDKNTSDICRPLDGLTAPVNDPVWKKIMPLNHFNCRCIVRQLGAGEPVTSAADKQSMYDAALGKMQPLFQMNPGIDGYVFRPDHPYFKVPKEDRQFAQSNFDLPIPKKDKL